MPNLKSAIRKYIEHSLGLKVAFSSVPKLKLPFYIQDAWQLKLMHLHTDEDTRFSVLLMLPVEEAYPGIITLRKHLEQLQKVTNKAIVYVSESLTAADRRSLIAHQICFIQPGNQLFIPDLAMDLREVYRRRRTTVKVGSLLPAAQAILISCLHRGWRIEENYTSSQLMKDYHCSRVTRAKVIDQLQTLGILKSGKKTNTYTFTATEAEIFLKAHSTFRSPVKRTVAIDRRLLPDRNIFLAGETALAHYSMLAEPSLPVYGMTNKHFMTQLQEGAFVITESVDHIQAWVEIWSYRSAATETPIADALSLILSMESNPDERIQIALDEVKENVAWLTSED